MISLKQREKIKTKDKLEPRHIQLDPCKSF